MVSCSSSDDDSEFGAGEGKKGGVKVTLAQSSFDDAVTRAAVEPQTQMIDMGNGLQMEATLTPEHSAMTRATVSPLAQDIKYCIVIYDKDNNFKATKTYTRGTENNEDPIPLPAGEGYKYIAYSVNSKDELPSFTEGNLDAFAVAATYPQDLMMTQATFSVSANATTPLQINLKHQFSSVTVVMDSYASGHKIYTVDGMTISSNHPTGIVTASGTTFEATFGGAATDLPIPFESFDPARLITSQSVIMYSNTSGESNISLASLKVGAKERPHVMASGFTIAPKTKYTLTLNITSGIEVGGLMWAPGNMIYDGTWIKNKQETEYGFEENQGAVGSKWLYDDAEPDTTGDNRNRRADPCALIKKGGKGESAGWRTPGPADFEKIVANYNGTATSNETTIGKDVTYNYYNNPLAELIH